MCIYVCLIEFVLLIGEQVNTNLLVSLTTNDSSYTADSAEY